MPSRDLKVTLLGSDRSGPMWDSAASNAQRFATQTSGIGGFLASAGGMALRFGAMAGTAMGAAGVAAGGLGLKTAASMEQAQIAFETMLGSADKAKSFLGDLQKFAASTPFEFPELQTAASSLISVGVDASKVIPIMTSLGNATSGMGTGSEGVKRATVALQQMSAAGRITGEDLNQLRDAGVPVFDLLSAATGKTKEQVSAMAQSGKLGRKEMEQLFAALESGKGLERFNGLMEKQSQSLSGKFFTLKDNVQMSLSRMVKPAIPGIKRGMDVLASTVVPAAERMVQQTISAGAALAKSFQGSGALSTFASSFASAAAQVMVHLGNLRQTFAVVMEFVRVNVLPVLVAVGEFILTRLVPTVVTLSGHLMAGLRSAFETIGRKIEENRPQLETLLQGFRQVADFVVTKVIPLLGPVLQATFETMGTAIGLALDVIGRLVDAFGWMKQTAETAWAGMQAVVGFVVGEVRSKIEALASIGDRIGGFFGRARDMAGDALGGLIGIVQGIPRRILDALGDLGGMLYDAGRRLIQGLIDGIMSMISKVGDALGGVASKIRGFFPGSPVREGPLTAWNDGSPGRNLMGLLAAGVDAGASDVSRAVAAAADVSLTPPGLSTGSGALGSARGGGTVRIEDDQMDTLARKIAWALSDRPSVVALDGRKVGASVRRDLAWST